MSFSYAPVQTERLILRPWHPSDEERLITLAAQEHIEHWLPDWRDYHQHAKGRIEMVISHYAINNPLENFLSWAIVLPQTNTLIGQIGLGDFDALGEKELSVGYWMDSAHTRHGYTTEAANTVAQIAFTRYGYDHIIATIEPENIPSRRVVEKAGFTYRQIVVFQETDMPEPRPFCYYRREAY